MSSFLQSHGANEFINRKKQLEILPIHLEKQRVLNSVAFGFLFFLGGGVLRGYHCTANISNDLLTAKGIQTSGFHLMLLVIVPLNYKTQHCKAPFLPQLHFY